MDKDVVFSFKGREAGKEAMTNQKGKVNGTKEGLADQLQSGIGRRKSGRVPS